MINREGGWNELLDKPAQESFGKCGFYSLNVTSSLKVFDKMLVLRNTMIHLL